MVKINSFKRRNLLKNIMSNKRLVSAVNFITLSIVIIVSFFAGVYHQKIENVIRPLFGIEALSNETLDLSSLQKTYQQLVTKYDGEIDKQSLIDGANAGLVSALGDDYTVYMNSEEAEAFENSLSGNIGAGVGAELSLRGGRVTVIRVLADNAAIKAGVRADDIILKVDDTSTDGFTVQEAVSLIRGEVNTVVKLTVLRGEEVKEFSITRQVINNPSVYSDINDTVGIITITRFDNETGDLAKNAARSLMSNGVKSIILDLRDNGGGYVDAAVDVASLWLENKTVVTERAGEEVRETLKSGNNAILNNVPTIVLVNGGSASASEIVAGALKDYGVAKLVGNTTFGKGSVQEPITLSDGSILKVTVAKWYTPNGNNISEKGIEPDHKVELTEDYIKNGYDSQLEKAKEILKS